MNRMLTPLIVLVVVLVAVAGFSAYRSFGHPGTQHPMTEARAETPASCELPTGTLERGSPVEEGQMFAVTAAPTAQ